MENKETITQFQNGRITNVNRKNFGDTQMFENLGKSDIKNNFQVESLYGIQEPSVLNKLYFSKNNLNIIQNMLRYNIYTKTNNKYIIDKQSEVELQIIMRSTYLQHSPNLNYNITEQIKYLNSLVVDWCSEKIIPEIEQYMGYLNEVQYQPMPIDLPLNLSQKGKRTLRSVTTTF
jgi:hypothetical protein